MKRDADGVGVLFRGQHLEFLRTAEGWEYTARRTRSQGVVVVAITEERRLLLIEQLRPPVGARTIELPAGVIDREETPRIAALRELEEETGYSARSVRPVCGGSTCPGVTDDTNTICIATGLQRVDDPNYDRQFKDGTRRHGQLRGAHGETEKLVVWEVPLQLVPLWLKRRRKGGNVIDLRIYAGLFFLERQAGHKY